MSVYTSGEWHVKPGHEDEFARAWQEFAEWSRSEIDPDTWALLLRDEHDGRHFRSLAGWRDQDEIQRWQAHPDYRRLTERLGELVDKVDIAVFERAVSVGEVPELSSAPRAGY